MNRTVRCAAIGLLLVLASSAPGAFAQQPVSAEPQGATGPVPVPRLIKFSGTLVDAQERPLAGPVGVTFALYAQQRGGAALWLETQNVSPDGTGNYAVLLGANSANGLPAELFTSGEARWLGIQVGQQPEHERILLVSVPYALKAGDAETLGGKPASAFLTTESFTSGSNSGSGTATTTAAGTLPKSGTGGVSKNTATTQAACASVTSDGTATVNSIGLFTTPCNIQSSLMTQALINGFPGVNLAGNNAGLSLSGTGTHQVTVTGATSGRLGQDAGGFFFSSDTNGANVRFLTNNGTLNERMRITSAGNVGIGTTTPGYSLQVIDSGNTGLRVQTNATGGVVASFGGFGDFQIDAQGIPAGRFDVTQGGNVGIATTTPLGRLEIQGGADSNAANDPQAVALAYRLGGFRHWIRTRHNTLLGSGNAIDFFVNNSASAGGSIGPGNGSLQVMTLDSGKVGIGTTTPGHSLEVIDSGKTGLRVQTNTVGGTVASFGGNGDFQIDAPGISGGRFDVTQAGNVGIGTATPAAKLDVAGAANFSGNSTNPIVTVTQLGNSSGLSVSSTFIGVLGTGVFGVRGIAATGNGVGVSGAAGPVGSTGGFFVDNGPGTFAGQFTGNVNISGTLTKGAGTFKIDHPLDPANKYLYHSFVESPDMMNIYDGMAVLDKKGEAWVNLPDWFEALNRDFRYQLTAIGAPQANLYIAKEISGNRFRIAGGKPGGKVSWLVTGVRQDAYAKAHPISVEQDKPPEEQGYYLHPEAFGQPATKSISAARKPSAPTPSNSTGDNVASGGKTP